MKKVILFFALALASSSLNAQSYQLLDHHCMGDYYVYFSDLAELCNGDVVANLSLYNIYPNGIHPLHKALGLCLLKVSPDEAQVIDSAIIHDNYIKCYNQIFKPNPNGEDYILARIKSELNRDILSISWLDENFMPSIAEVTVPLDDEVDVYPHFCLGGNNDIVMANPVRNPNGAVFTRYSLDGTLKNQVFYSDSICPVDRLFKSKMKVWDEEKTEFMVCGLTAPFHNIYSYWVLDSTLTIIDSASIHPNPTGIHFEAHEDNDIEKLDEETYLLATHYWGVHEGILVSKRDRESQVDLKKLLFKKNGSADQEIIGLRRSNDGNFFLAYLETNLKVVKFDPDLNILWQRTYIFLDSPNTTNHQFIALTNGGLAVGGILLHDNQIDFPLFIIIINDNGTAGSPETDAFLRPYMFYPNPATDQLHLQYSPDVQPTQIELFDLQGRLVCTQTNSLENLDLQGLATGQYLMKVTLENGKVYTDKVIKE